MQKNTGTITIVILLTLIFCAVIGATVFGWFGFKSIKEKDAAKPAETKPESAPAPTLRSDEVLCSSPAILAHRYSIDPEVLINLLETGRTWTAAAKEASLQYFKKTVDDDARRYGEEIKWEVVTTDELRFVVRLGSGLSMAVERMMQEYDITFKKTCLEKFSRLFPSIPPFRRTGTTGGNGTTGGTGTTTTGLNLNKILGFGTQGEEVKAFQKLCNRLNARRGLPLIAVNGDYDEATDRAYQAWFSNIPQNALSLKTAATYASGPLNLGPPA